jgi:hypothetical protein
MKKITIYCKDGIIFETTKNELSETEKMLVFTGIQINYDKLAGKFSIPYENVSFVYEPLSC